MIRSKTFATTMVRTRAQEKGDTSHESGNGLNSKIVEEPGPKKRPHSKVEASNTSNKLAANKKARKDEVNEQDPTSADSKPYAANPKLSSLIKDYGSIPLSETAVDDPLSPKPETILALVLNAMFSSTRISHELAAKAVATAIKADYHKIDNLKKTTWEDRARVLTEGGYTRYREKTATWLGELVEFILTKYGGCAISSSSALALSPSKPRLSRERIRLVQDWSDLHGSPPCTKSPRTWELTTTQMAI